MPRTAGLFRRAMAILESPLVYAACQFVLAPGAEHSFTTRLRNAARELPPGDLILDVGCGPASWLFRIDLNPVGLDYSPKYIQTYCKTGHTGVVGSADQLPFASHCFSSVWTIGMLHHLTDDSVREAVQDMIRVCRKGGYVFILDAVLPRSKYRRPIAYVLRRLDRGSFVRSEDQFLSLLREVAPSFQAIERFTFALNGLEAVTCSIQVPDS